MRSRLLLLAVAVSAIGLADGTPARAAVGGTPTILVQSVPPVRGLPFAFLGTTQTTDAHGSTEFTLGSAAAASFVRDPLTMLQAFKLRPKSLPDGTTFRLDRWYVKNTRGVHSVQDLLRGDRHRRPRLIAAISEYVPTTLGFIDPKAGSVDPGEVDSVRLKRSDGAVFTFSGKRLRRPVVLKATRIVPRGGELVSKRLLYRVEAVTIEGNNLVNRAQQSFEPAATHRVTLKLLFYSAKFVARDRLFRFPVGSRVTLEFPNGRLHQYKLDSSGTLVVPALPRGTYHVTVHAHGLKMRMPIALTRDQVATINVVSYLDIATVLSILIAVAVGLLLVGRPALRRGLLKPFRRRLEKRAAEVAEA